MITRLIAAQNIETQEELAGILREHGFSVTQATVSRDIKELRLVKVLTSEGRYRYATVEKAEADKSATFSVEKDASPVEAKIVDTPDMQNVLEDYPAPLEQQNIETYNWDMLSVREQLRKIYVLDAEGNPVMDGNTPLKRGPGTEDELLSQLFESAKAQQSRLNSTRAALSDLRERLATVVTELNKLKPEARQDKVTIVEQKEKIGTLETEKSELENQVTRLKGQIDEYTAEITSLKDEVQTAKDETEAAKEQVEKQQKMVDQLKKLLRDALVSSSQRGEKVEITTLPAGDKGKLIEVDNENMFAIVEFTPEAMKELKGEELRNPVPQMELGLRRPGLQGAAGEFSALGVLLHLLHDGFCVQQPHAGKRLPEARHLDFRFFACHFDLCCHGSPFLGCSFRPSILQGGIAIAHLNPFARHRWRV